MLRRLMPAPAKYRYNQFMRPQCRYERREFTRLKLLLRYQPTTTNVIGAPLEIVDAAPYLFMYKELVEQQIYRFEAGDPAPKGTATS